MSQWDTDLEIKFPELFSSMDRKGFPLLDDFEQGIRIFADKLSFEDGLLSCHLLISFAFKRQFFSSFQRLGQAINILIENADTGQSHQLNLNDPHKIYKAVNGDNFSEAVSSDKKGVKTSYREIPMTLELNNPGWGPHLFIRASLQNYTSNILALDCSKELSVTSYLNTQEYSVQFSDDENE